MNEKKHDLMNKELDKWMIEEMVEKSNQLEEMMLLDHAWVYLTKEKQKKD